MLRVHAQTSFAHDATHHLLPPDITGDAGVTVHGVTVCDGHTTTEERNPPQARRQSLTPHPTDTKVLTRAESGVIMTLSFHHSHSPVQQRKRRMATTVHSDSEASAKFAKGSLAPLSSDSEDDFVSFSTQVFVVARKATCQVAGDGHFPGGVDSHGSAPTDFVDLEQDFSEFCRSQCFMERTAHRQPGFVLLATNKQFNENGGCYW